MKSNNVVVLLGRKGAGKDTYLESLKDDNLNHLKIAEPMKKVSKLIFGADSDEPEIKEIKCIIPMEVLLCEATNGYISLFDLRPSNYDEVRNYILNKYEKFLSPTTSEFHISPRDFLQIYGSEVCRSQDKFIFIKALIKKLLRFYNSDSNLSNTVHISDGRFANESEFLSQYDSYKTQILFIFRYIKDGNKFETNKVIYDTHVSEELNNKLDKLGLQLMNEEITHEKLNEEISLIFGNDIPVTFIAKEWTKTPNDDFSNIVFQR